MRVNAYAAPAAGEPLAPTTIERHATDSAVAYAQYVAATKAIRRSP